MSSWLKGARYWRIPFPGTTSSRLGTSPLPWRAGARGLMDRRNAARSICLCSASPFLWSPKVSGVAPRPVFTGSSRHCSNSPAGPSPKESRAEQTPLEPFTAMTFLLAVNKAHTFREQRDSLCVEKACVWFNGRMEDCEWLFFVFSPVL